MIKEFFGLFYLFLRVDLIESFKKRNIRIIYLFYITFFALISSKISMEKKEALLKNLREIITEYIKNKEYIELIDCRDFEVSNLSSLKEIYETLNMFSVAMNIFLKKNENTLFKQSLIESYNAFSHILNGIKSSDTSFNKNVRKAYNHFYRGALDYYKTIIRKEFEKIDKEKLKELRFEEFSSIGIEASNNKIKKEIIDKYKKLVTEIK